MTNTGQDAFWIDSGAGLSGVRSSSAVAPDLFLIDLRGSGITRCDVGRVECRTLVVTGQTTGEVTLTLYFNPVTAPVSEALALLRGITQRLEDPLRQLL